MHAAVYLLVNLGLAALALSSGRDWHAYPTLLGWGLGLAIHGAAGGCSAPAPTYVAWSGTRRAR